MEQVEKTIDEKITEFVDLTNDKRELQSQLRALQRVIDDLSADIVQHFEENDRQSVKQNGATVYLSREMAVKVLDSAGVVKALEDAGLGELVAPQSQRLKSWIKETLESETTGTWEIDKDKLPEGIRDMIEVDEFYRLNCRKG